MDKTKEKRKLKVLRRIQLEVEKILGSKCPDIEIKLSKGIVQSRTPILFEPDSDRLEKTQSTKHLISQLSNALNTIEKVYNNHRDDFKHYILFEVAGHTHAPPNVDPMGKQSLDVSSRRAQRVRKEIERRGTNHKILTSKGYGGSQPKDKLRPELNRRVELRLLDHDIAFPWCRSEEAPYLLRPTPTNHDHVHTQTPSIPHLTQSRENTLLVDSLLHNSSKIFPSIDLLKPILGHAAASTLRTAVPSLVVPPELIQHHFTPHMLPHTYTNKSIPSKREYTTIGKKMETPSMEQSKRNVDILNIPRLSDNLRPRSPNSPCGIVSEPHLVDIPKLTSLEPDLSEIKFHVSVPSKEMCFKLSEVSEGKAGILFAPSAATATSSGIRRYVRAPVLEVGTATSMMLADNIQTKNVHHYGENKIDRTSNETIWAARQSELWAGIARLQRQMAERDKSRVSSIEDRMSRISMKLGVLMDRIRRVEKQF